MVVAINTAVAAASDHNASVPAVSEGTGSDKTVSSATTEPSDTVALIHNSTPTSADNVTEFIASTGIHSVFDTAPSTVITPGQSTIQTSHGYRIDTSLLLQP